MSRGECRGTFLFTDNYFLGSPVFKPYQYELVLRYVATQRDGLAHGVAHLHDLLGLFRLKLRCKPRIAIRYFESAIYDGILAIAQVTPLSGQYVSPFFGESVREESTIVGRDQQVTI